MDISWIREKVKNVPRYKGQITWINKVDNMPDIQVYAIHMNFIKSGMYDEKIGKEESEQLTLFDIFPEAMKGEKAYECK